MASTSQSQPNGVPSSSAPGPSQPASQPTQNTTTSGSATVQNTQATGTSTGTTNNSNGGNSQTAPQAPSSPTTSHAPRPRDARTIELLLTSQGVTSFDERVPLLLLDFAYRHTSSLLSDALHLSTDPYTTHAGAKASSSSGAAPTAPSAGEAVVTSNAINLAIASRQSYQFHGAAGAGGGGTSKDWLQDHARERNKVALPRVLANEWGVRLPNERFVLSGTGWGLRDQWGEEGGPDDESDDDDMFEDVNIQNKDASGNATGAGEGAQDGEGGGLDELLGDDMGDEDMEGME
ncbi:TFIID-31kDa-domain-containing protein [Hypoxylon trugodes]|uniref:TFIID-31kDa-domain-containing protein n=1 Tax=Hypoxylon trugodes TaxID=326681 RepID=UPI00219B7CED|nr:TFIID-31kDa-domain-containing protein [Hypoxylon trugodes]KAI1383857.1 TFIID-31kDa-domain-containing protein [Hypoxylon trugodes]